MLVELILILTLQPIINFWLKDKAIIVDYRFSIVFAITGLIFMWNSILSNFASGIGKLKTSIIFQTCGAFLIVPLSYLFTHLTGSWIGVTMASGLSMLPFCVMQSIWFEKYFNEITSRN